MKSELICPGPDSVRYPGFEFEDYLSPRTIGYGADSLGETMVY